MFTHKERLIGIQRTVICISTLLHTSPHPRGFLKHDSHMAKYQSATLYILQGQHFDDDEGYDDYGDDGGGDEAYY